MTDTKPPSAEALKAAAKHYPNMASQHCIALALTIDAFAEQLAAGRAPPTADATETAKAIIARYNSDGIMAAQLHDYIAGGLLAAEDKGRQAAIEECGLIAKNGAVQGTWRQRREAIVCAILALADKPAAGTEES